MSEKRLKILFIPKWYPNEDDIQNGVFIRKHALVVNSFADVDVLFTYISNENMASKFNYHGISEYIYKIKNISSFINFLNRIYILIKHLRKLNAYDSVHIHIIDKYSLLVYLFSTIYKKKLYISEHWSGYFSGEYDNLSFIDRKIYQFVYKKAFKVSVVSKFLRESVKNKLGEREVSVIPNVIMTKELLKVEKDNSIIVVSDLVDKIKNISGVIKAYYNSEAIKSGVKLKIIGDGIDADKIKKLVCKLNIEDKVNFKGRLAQEDVVREMQKSMFLIVNSIVETFSIVIIEAFANNIPVISTKCGGPEEIVNKKTGILIDKNDEVALINAINKMYNGVNLFDVNEMNNIVNKFTVDKIKTQFQSFY